MKSFGFAVSLAACLAGVMESAAAQLDAEVKAKAFAWLDASDKDSFTLDASGKVEKWADKSGKENDATAYVEKGVKARGKVGEANGVPDGQDRLGYRPQVRQAQREGVHRLPGDGH